MFRVYFTDQIYEGTMFGFDVERIWGNMKKYVVFGLIAGVAISALAVYFRRKKLAGTEFYGFFDSSTVADELFGDAFEELPDKP
jgi:hypothetical protein